MNKELEKIIILLLKEIEEKENILNVSGAKGYGTGKARAKDYHGVLKNLGVENNEEQEQYQLKPVQISKAFKKEK
jgi:hypothetical protein